MKKHQAKIILERTYDWNILDDVGRDVSEAIEELEGTLGDTWGSVTITITYESPAKYECGCEGPYGCICYTR